MLVASAVFVARAAAAERLLRVCGDPNNLPFSNDRGEGFENRLAAEVSGRRSQNRTGSMAASPQTLFDTIVKGRPNGMPTWGAKIPEYQVWQLVAYIRSMNGQQPSSATPRRSDMLEPTPQTIQNKVPGVTK
jgi:hypothetical protein